MRIGELSKRSGVSIRMLRYYEDEGLLAPPRTEARYREYDARDVETVKRIRLLAAANLTLPAIRQILPCVLDENLVFQPCSELRSILHRQVGVLDERIDALSQSRTILAGFVEGLPSER